MPVDSVHAVIEREVQKLIVWSPSQWATYFESARKRPRPYKVIALDYTDFKNFDEMAKHTFTAATLKKIQFKKIRTATFKRKHPDQMVIKYSMQTEAESHVIKLCEKTSAKGKGKAKSTKGKIINEKEETYTIKPLYRSRLPISMAKYNDLVRLCNNGTIPRRFHDEYRKLPHDSKVCEALNQTDEDEDSDE